MEYNSHRALTNTAWNVTSYIWPVLFAIVITPIVVKSMGIRDYGLYTFFNTVISLLGLLDFGISAAVSKYLAEYYAQKDSEKIRKMLGTALVIYATISLVGLVIFVVSSFIPFFSHTFAEFSKYQTGIIFAGLTFTLMSLSSMYTITFSALQRFDISSKLGIILLSIQQVSILILILMGYSINAIFIVQFIIGFISFFVQKHFAEKILPELPTRFLFDKKEAIRCYKFGLVTFVNNIATVSLTYLDRLIMPFFLGPSNLTYYSLPGNISSRIPGISNSLSGILFPMTSSLHGLGDVEKIKILYVRSFRLITVIAAAITVTTITYAYQILQYWITLEFAEKATVVLIILACTNFALALIGPLSNFLLGLGKLKFLTTLSISMAIINTILLVILLPIAGINGAAWAYLLSLVPAIYMFYFTEKYYLLLIGRKKYYTKLILGNLLVSCIVYVIGKVLLIHLMTSLFTVLVVSGVTLLLYITLYWIFKLFEKEDIDSIKLFVNKSLTLNL